MQIAWSSGDPGNECVHLERTSKAKPDIKLAVLKCESPQDMMSKGLMPSEWGDKCDRLNTAAVQCGVDSVFPVLVEDGKLSRRWHFFTVFTNENDNWCYFGQRRVTFDSVTGQWNCQCRNINSLLRPAHDGNAVDFLGVAMHPSSQL